ncbi:MAG: hypothetical protein ACREBR_01065 [bacterium]
MLYVFKAGESTAVELGNQCAGTKTGLRRCIPTLQPPVLEELACKTLQSRSAPRHTNAHYLRNLPATLQSRSALK